jgi:dihydroorotase
MNKIVIKGGRVICPLTGLNEERDLLISEGKIEAVDRPGAFSSLSNIEIEDASGKLVVPGLIDIHVHLREPGFEYKETIESGSRAAVAGGFTTVCCMPNTKPVNDNAQITKFIVDTAKAVGLCRVLPIGAITKGSLGKELSPMMELKEAGCVAFSDDGFPVDDANIMRRALEYSLMVGLPLTCHEEVRSISKDHAMNEGEMSLRLGLKGWPGAAEDIMIARDIELSRLTGARVHCCHVTTARGAKLIERAKEDGILVTGEVSPHHFTLTDEAVDGFNAMTSFNTLAKCSPPLRTEADRDGVLTALASGVLDCIATDHAPHEADSKNREFSGASFGMLGFQTALPLTLAQVRLGRLSLERAIEALTLSPARVFGLNFSGLKKGAPADIVVIDLNKRYVLNEQNIYSKSKNTPFLGSELIGAAVKTFFSGKKVYDDK